MTEKKKTNKEKNTEIEQKILDYREGKIELNPLVERIYNDMLIKFVHSKIAKNYPKTEVEELISYGVDAIYRAIDGFDFSKNVHFSTYFYYCVFSEIYDSMRKYGQMLNTKNLKNWKNKGWFVPSLIGIWSQDEKPNGIQDEDLPNAEVIPADMTVLKQDFFAFVTEGLTKKQRRVLFWRFYKGWSAVKIGKKIGKSAEMVRLYIKEAIKVMQNKKFQIQEQFAEQEWLDIEVRCGDYYKF